METQISCLSSKSLTSFMTFWRYKYLGLHKAMQKIPVILLLFYFVFGTLLLPQGDFSTMADLPRMYQHCKETEDPDMDICDFVIEHLLQIDDDQGEAKNDNDHERPHQPIQFNHLSAPISAKQRGIKMEQPAIVKCEKQVVTDDIYLSDFPADVFRPPMIG